MPLKIYPSLIGTQKTPAAEAEMRLLEEVGRRIKALAARPGGVHSACIFWSYEKQRRQTQAAAIESV